MKFVPENMYHMFNQGNNQQLIFHTDDDYLTFLRLIRTHILPHTQIIAWCLMPDHFHLLVYTDESSCTIIKQGGLEIEKLTNGIRKLLSGYARIFNKRYHQTGTLFRQKTKAKNLFEEVLVARGKYTLQDYCSQCFSYMHQNPVAAGLVKQPGDWQFSSYLDYAGMRNGNLCNKELAAKYCYYDCRDFISQQDKKTGADFWGLFQKDALQSDRPGLTGGWGDDC